ncbi:thiolase-like protein [Colletotrichum cereale]|nr:thiolase-like protein [Colletotrichum cereale]
MAGILLDRVDYGGEGRGISGGLFTMLALAVSKDFDDLAAALLEIGRLLVRLFGALEKTGKAYNRRSLSTPAGRRIAIVGVLGRGLMCNNINKFWQVIMICASTGDIDIAVAGASNILNYLYLFVALNTGNCKTFCNDADGYCCGDFVRYVVLKRLEDAEADNNKILAVIAASGRNYLGNLPLITTPDAGAQERLFCKVLCKACVSAEDILYVEMYGTGTPVGDPVELSAVGSLFKHCRPLGANRPIPVGSVKANVGHGEGAAGVALLMKCIKIFETNTVPLQAGMPYAYNPEFPALADLNVEILLEPREFRRRKDNVPRRILLNNFNAARGNSCLLLEEYIGKASTATERRTKDGYLRLCHVVVISA